MNDWFEALAQPAEMADWTREGSPWIASELVFLSDTPDAGEAMALLRSSNEISSEMIVRIITVFKESVDSGVSTNMMTSLL